ncbi:MAG: DUF2007 domain-containing protein [Xanthomonadales bacterium]|nr:DUF2007 domain-containing protein [Xanthomonadales bacterium]
MKIAYTAANIADAHLLRQWLEAEGIQAFVLGEYLRGAAGDLPANTEVFVWVADDDLDAARAIVAAWERETPALPDDEDAADEAAAGTGEAMAGRAADAEALAAKPGGYTLARGMIVLIAVVICGVVLLGWLRTLAERPG